MRAQTDAAHRRTPAGQTDCADERTRVRNIHDGLYEPRRYFAVRTLDGARRPRLRRFYADGWLQRVLPDLPCPLWAADGPVLAWAYPAESGDMLRPHTLHVAGVTAAANGLLVIGAPEGDEARTLHLSPLPPNQLARVARAMAALPAGVRAGWAATVQAAAAQRAAAAPHTLLPPAADMPYSVQGSARLGPAGDLATAGAWAVAVDPDRPADWAAANVPGWTIQVDIAELVRWAEAAGMSLLALQAMLPGRANGITRDWSNPEIVLAPSAASAARRFLRKYLSSAGKWHAL